MEWLAEHEEIQMYTHELHALQSGHAAEFAQLMYDLPAGTNYKRGYKAPRDICNTEALDLIAKYWPQSKLIVGLRHPVLWYVYHVVCDDGLVPQRASQISPFLLVPSLR